MYELQGAVLLSARGGSHSNYSQVSTETLETRSRSRLSKVFHIDIRTKLIAMHGLL